MSFVTPHVFGATWEYSSPHLAQHIHVVRPHCVNLYSYFFFIHFFRITSAVDGGLIEGWKIKFTNELIICNLYKPHDLIEPSTNALTISEITGPFVLFCVGFTISFFIFFMELALQRFLKRTEIHTVYPKIRRQTIKIPLGRRYRNFRQRRQKMPPIAND